MDHDGVAFSQDKSSPRPASRPLLVVLVWWGDDAGTPRRRTRRRRRPQPWPRPEELGAIACGRRARSRRRRCDARVFFPQLTAAGDVEEAGCAQREVPTGRRQDSSSSRPVAQVASELHYAHRRLPVSLVRRLCGTRGARLVVLLATGGRRSTGYTFTLAPDVRRGRSERSRRWDLRRHPESSSAPAR